MGPNHTPDKASNPNDYRILVVPLTPGAKVANEVYDFVYGELDNAHIETRMVLQDPAIVRRERASADLLKALKANAARNHLDSCPHDENDPVDMAEAATDGCLNCLTNLAIAKAEG